MRALPFALLVSLALLAPACNSTRNAPPEPDLVDGREPGEFRYTFDEMTEAALLADMSVAPHHFLPHRSMLTPAGEQRVIRLARLMHAYGGVVRLTGDQADDDLMARRADTVVALLADCGVDTTTEIVRQDIAGSDGMSAQEAILIRQYEGQYQPPNATGGGASLAPLP